MQKLEKIIQGCKNNENKSQKRLYDLYSPVLFGICIRYAQNREEAEDVLQEGFIKILTKIDGYTGLGSFEGWMKRIMVNTAITHYHKNKKFLKNVEINDVTTSKSEIISYGNSDFTKEELVNVIKTLSPGYKQVFNLYAIEGFKHNEIAKKLNIDENTSKSQYSRAKKIIRTKLKLLSKIKLHKTDENK